MSSTKLSPIYAALDGQQYNRAIKLCLALPRNHIMGRALLAHAYAKCSRRLEALVVLQSILLEGGGSTSTTTASSSNGGACFPELQLEIKYALERRPQSSEQQSSAASQASSSSPQPAAATTATTPKPKSGKKGKKRSVAGGSAAGANKSTPTGTAAATIATASQESLLNSDESWHDFDWVDQLDTPPSIPDDWHDEATAFPLNVQPPTDPTLLATMVATLSFLRCYLTAYQLYAWVIVHCPRDLEYVKQTYLLGLTVWMAPQWYYTTALKQSLLSQLQVTALQVARLQQQTTGITSTTATAWAAQTALWQINNNKNNNSKDADRTPNAAAKREMLPRLAESLALKACQISSTTNNSSAGVLAVSGGIGSNVASSSSLQPNQEDVHSFLMETENFSLYLRTLDVQQKWDQKLQALQQRLDALAASEHDGNPRHQALREELARVWIQLGRCSEARQELAHLLRSHPDQWDYWNMYITNDDSDQKMDSEHLIQEILDQNANPQYPLRGPHLARLQRELLLLQQCGDNTNDNDNTPMVQGIISYGNLLGREASCTSDDLRVYIQYVVASSTGAANAAATTTLTDWIRANFVVVRRQTTTNSSNSNSDAADERHKELRGYIFGIQVLYEIYTANNNPTATTTTTEFLPDWLEILQVWNDFKTLEDPVQAQKENRAGDELILLAVQQLTMSNTTTTNTNNKQTYCHNLVLAATILDAAMEYSPHNAYLKICAILVYGNLNAVQRSLELFRSCFIKHIQYESCAYLILDRLCAGGLYEETLGVCQEILRFQTTAIRDAAEYTGRAMESGTLIKANEFMAFQRERINKSLTTLEAKGLVLDCAPMFLFRESQKLGHVHGIVGGPDDKDRVCQMIAEAHNPHGAFSLLSRLRGTTEQDLLELYTENRDLDILSQISILEPQPVSSREQILSKSIRRCHHHNLLIRASLCLDATKGPKKGKITKSPPELTKRCASLLVCVREAEEYTKNDVHQSDMTKIALITMLYLCRTIVVVSGGVTDETDTIVVLDRLDLREEAASKFLTSAMESVKQCHAAFTLIRRTKEDTVIPLVGIFLSDCLVALYALIKMCGNTFELYGWGKRKRGTRKSAAALADVSVAVKIMIEEMKVSLEPPFPMPDDETCFSRVHGIIDTTMIENSKLRITDAQLETKTRIEQILSTIMETLETFDVEV